MIEKNDWQSYMQFAKRVMLNCLNSKNSESSFRDKSEYFDSLKKAKTS